MLVFLWNYWQIPVRMLPINCFQPQAWFFNFLRLGFHAVLFDIQLDLALVLNETEVCLCAVGNDNRLQQHVMYASITREMMQILATMCCSNIHQLAA